MKNKIYNWELFIMQRTSNYRSKLIICLLGMLLSLYQVQATDYQFNKDQSKSVSIRFVSADTGTFVRNLVITDTCGKTRIVRLKASVKVPKALAGDDIAICFKDTAIIGLDALGGTPPYNYLWSPAAGLSGINIKQPKASPATTTSYFLEVTDSKGCKGFDTVIVTVNPLPIPSITGLNSVCADNIYNYNTPSVSQINNQWSVTGGTIQGSSTGNSASVEWGSGTSGTIKLVQVNSATGCKDSVILTITINPLPKPSITGNADVCVGGINVFDASAGANLSNLWSASGGTIIGPVNGTKVEIQWNAPGKGKVMLKQTNTLTGCLDSVEIEVNINPRPYIELGSDIKICYGDSVQIGKTPTGTPPFVYTWFPSNTVSDFKAERPYAFPENTQRYTVLVKDKFGCEWLDSITIIVNPKITVSVGRDTTICPGDTIRMKPIITGGVSPFKSYKWEPASGLSNPNSPNPDLIAFTPGTFKYTLTVTDDNNCPQSASIEIKVRNNPTVNSSKSTLDFGNLDPCETERLDSLQFTNTSSEEIEITGFDIPSGFTKVSPGLPRKLKPGESVTILVRFTPTNEGNSQGSIIINGSPCEWSQSIKVKGFKEKMIVSANIGSVDFGRSLTCLGISKDTTITINNTGTSDVQFRLNPGLLSYPFALIEPTGDFTIPPSGNIKLKIHYEPISEGLFVENFELPFTAGTCNSKLSFNLNGEHVEPKMQSSLRQIDFPPILGCDTKFDTVITVENTGTIDVEIIEVLPGSDFKCNQVPTKLSPGELKTITISFTPSDTGAYSGILVLKYDPCGNTDTIQVTGNKQGIAFSMPNEIDFGELIYCKDKIITKNGNILNVSAGDIGGSIDFVQVEGPFSSNLKPDTLINGVPLDFIVSFIPDQNTPDGLISGKIAIYISPCNLQKEILLKAVKKDVSFEIVKSLDFGLVAVGEQKSDILRLQNNGTADLQIDELTGFSPPKFVLDKTEPAIPALLKPKDEMLIFVTYTPDGSGRDTITINAKSSTPCNFDAYGGIAGSGTDDSAETVVYIDTLHGLIGRELYQPLKISSSRNLLQSGIDSFYAKVSFNKTLLLPTKNTPMGLINNDLRIIEFTGKWNQGDWRDTVPHSVLKELHFLPALGNLRCTPLTIEEFSWFGGKSSNSIRHGQFCLDSICIEGGERLINPAQIVMLSIYPNPSDKDINLELNLTESGPTFIKLLNLIGEIVYIEQLTGDIGNLRTVIPINDIASGTYYLMLETPTYKEVKFIEIYK